MIQTENWVVYIPPSGVSPLARPATRQEEEGAWIQHMRLCRKNDGRESSLLQLNLAGARLSRAAPGKERLFLL